MYILYSSNAGTLSLHNACNGTDEFRISWEERNKEEMDKKTAKKKDSINKNKVAMNPLLVMVIVVCLCAIATYIIPAGRYEVTYNEAVGKEVIDPDSFQYISRTPAGISDLLQSLTLGLQNGAYVIFFLLIIGGMFGILNGTGALNVGIANILKKIKNREYLMIPILMIFFGCGSTFCGNFEEFLVFVPLILACCITVGYDSLTAVGIIFMVESLIHSPWEPLRRSQVFPDFQAWSCVFHYLLC